MCAHNFQLKKNVKIICGYLCFYIKLNFCFNFELNSIFPAHSWRIIVQHWPFISQPLALVAIAIVLWMIAYVLLPDYTLPNTPIMRIFFLFVGAQLSGVLVTFLRLPDMLGMLFFGVIYTNVGLADFTGYDKFEAFLR